MRCKTTRHQKKNKSLGKSTLFKKKAEGFRSGGSKNRGNKSKEENWIKTGSGCFCCETQWLDARLAAPGPGSAYLSTSSRVEVLSDLRELSVWFTVTVEEEGEGKRLAS